MPSVASNCGLVIFKIHIILTFYSFIYECACLSTDEHDHGSNSEFRGQYWRISSLLAWDAETNLSSSGLGGEGQPLLPDEPSHSHVYFLL